MTYLHPVAAVPNNLITDTSLSYTAKRVAFVLLLLAGCKLRSPTAAGAVASGRWGPQFAPCILPTG